MAIIALIAFILLLSGILIYKEFHVSSQIKDANFYQNQILGYQLDEFWQMS